MLSELIIAPSVLSADFYNLKSDLSILKNNKIKYLHHDIMDNHFVPNLTYGYPVVKSIIKDKDFYHDLHFMVLNPDLIIPKYYELKPNTICFHAEACLHPQRLLSDIRKNGIKAGLALNPATGIEVLRYLLDDLDFLLIMSVNPGFSGQKFLTAIKDKIDECVDMISDKNILLAIDGGVDCSNIKNLSKKGIEYFVCGSSVFKNREITKNIQKLKTAINVK